ncbi:hypothetical protein PFISCL1PPCAC_21749, partial [Pristionchus fissidentatus]
QRIKCALVSLEFERIQALEDDEEREAPIRDAIYALIQSLHLTFQKFTKIGDQSDASIVEECRRRIHELSGKSNDVLFIVISQALDVMSLMHKPDSDARRIQRSLVSLEFERVQSLENDEQREIPLRDATYGLIHCLHLTLEQLEKIKDHPNVKEEKQEEGLIMTKDECREAALDSVNNPSVRALPIDLIEKSTMPSLNKIPKPNTIDPAVKEEDPFGFISDELNYPAYELNNEDTEFVTEGEKYDDMHNSARPLETSRKTREISSKVIDYTES